MSTLPLADVRVIAIEQYGAGPWGSLQLADLGADVIKIEDPASGGDVGRYIPPYQADDASLFFEAFNRNKRSVALDLRDPQARELFGRLVASADAVYSNLRGDVPAKLGITYDALKHLNPRIVCCSLSGFGQTGPRASERAFDNVVQALAGWMSLAGEPDGPPTKTGPSLVDFLGGYVAALSMLAGIWRARRDGVGCECDVSLFETALAQLNYLATWTASRGYEPQRQPGSAHWSIVPFQNFATADGAIAIACSKEHLWRRLCGALGRPELADDRRYADFAARHRHRDTLVATLEREFAGRTNAESLAALRAAGVPAGPVNTVREALEDEQVTARGALAEVEHPTLGTVRHVASPLRVGTERRPVTRAPLLGEHTREVLREVASDDELAALGG